MKINFTKACLTPLVVSMFAVFGSATQAMAQDSYEIYVGGTEVTPANSTDVLGDGKVSYDDATKTLKLKDVAIFAHQDNCGVEFKKASSDTYNLEFDGCVEIFSEYKYGIASNSNLKVTGVGSLFVQNQSAGSALYVGENSTFTIKECSIDADGQDYGFTGSGASSTLVLEDAALYAHGNEGGICNIGALTFKDTKIITPRKDAAFDEALMGVAVKNVLCKTVRTSSVNALGIYVLGMEVTPKNAADILKNGSLGYNADTHTLTMNNLDINAPTAYVVGIQVDKKVKNLTVDLKGYNKIQAGEAAVKLSANTVFSGEGSLLLGGSINNGLDLRDKATLSIKDCEVNIGAATYGITGFGEESLVVENATLRVYHSAGAILGIMAMQLKKAKIDTPAGASFDPEKYAVVQGGNVCTEVSIVPDQSAVARIEATPQATDGRIFDLQGRQLNEAPAHGIYIQGGKKHVATK